MQRRCTPTCKIYLKSQQQVLISFNQNRRLQVNIYFDPLILFSNVEHVYIYQIRQSFSIYSFVYCYSYQNKKTCSSVNSNKRCQPFFSQCVIILQLRNQVNYFFYIIHFTHLRSHVCNTNLIIVSFGNNNIESVSKLCTFVEGCVCKRR